MSNLPVIPSSPFTESGNSPIPPVNAQPVQTQQAENPTRIIELEAIANEEITGDMTLPVDFTEKTYKITGDQLAGWLGGNIDGFVTLDTTQTITGTKTFEQPIRISVGAGDSLINLDSSADSSNFIRGKVGGVNNWFLGKGGITSDTVAFQSYISGTKIELSDVVASNENFSTAATAPTAASHLTRKDYVDGLIPDVSNFVTLDTVQTITATKVFQDANVDLVSDTGIISPSLYQEVPVDGGVVGVEMFLDGLDGKLIQRFQQSGSSLSMLCINYTDGEVGSNNQMVANAATPTEPEHLTRKDYVDGVLASALTEVANAIDSGDTTALRAAINQLGSV